MFEFVTQHEFWVGLLLALLLLASACVPRYTVRPGASVFGKEPDG